MELLRRPVGLEAKIWLLTGVICLATVASYLSLVEPLGTGPAELEVPWWAIAAGWFSTTRVPTARR